MAKLLNSMGCSVNAVLYKHVLTVMFPQSLTLDLTVRLRCIQIPFKFVGLNMLYPGIVTVERRNEQSQQEYSNKLDMPTVTPFFKKRAGQCHEIAVICMRDVGTGRIKNIQKEISYLLQRTLI